MQFGVIIPLYRHFARPETVQRLVRAAEVLGYDSAWFADHIVIPAYATPVYGETFFEPITTMVFGAGLTDRLKFGIDVLVTPYRPPVFLAKILSTLDVLSGGRLILGAGVGILKGEFEALGVPYEERGPRTDEYLAAIKALWTEERPSFEGRYVRFSGIYCEPKPVQKPHPPIWIGGNSRRALRRAVELGNGWHPYAPSLEDYARGVEALRAALARAGRADPFTFSYSAPEMRVLDAPWRPPATPPARPLAFPAQLRADYASLPLQPPLAPDGRPLLTGTPDQIADDIQRLIDRGMNYLLTRFFAGSPEIDAAACLRAMERFAAEVMPRFHR